MVDLDRVRHELKLWGEWQRTMPAATLGYPRQSVEQTANSGGRGRPEMPDDPVAERMDRILAGMDRQLFGLIERKYAQGQNRVQIASVFRISESEYQTRLRCALHWILGRYDSIPISEPSGRRRRGRPKKVLR